MPLPHVKLARAHEEDYLVIVTETDGTVYKCLVEDITRFRTTEFEV